MQRKNDIPVTPCQHRSHTKLQYYLQFNPETNLWKCEKCGSSYTTEEVIQIIVEQYRNDLQKLHNGYELAVSLIKRKGD